MLKTPPFFYYNPLYYAHTSHLVIKLWVLEFDWSFWACTSLMKARHVPRCLTKSRTLHFWQNYKDNRWKMFEKRTPYVSWTATYLRPQDLSLSHNNYEKYTLINYQKAELSVKLKERYNTQSACFESKPW